ncbi:MAG TPA: type VII secretion target [Phytomonospora sp.]
MEVDESKMRRASAKIRTIGHDAQAYLDREKAALDFGSQGNDGFGTMQALKSTVDKLHQAASRLASDSTETGDNITRAADNHRENERVQKQNIDANLRALTTLRTP